MASVLTRPVTRNAIVTACAYLGVWGLCDAFVLIIVLFRRMNECRTSLKELNTKVDTLARLKEHEEEIEDEPLPVEEVGMKEEEEDQDHARIMCI